MKLLLDTHVFIWWDSEPSKLSPAVLQMCSDRANSLLLSVASAWEIQIKHQLGKVTLAVPLAEIISGQIRLIGLHVLPVVLEHVLALDSLPPHHKDPFDRLLMAQAIAEDATLISHDAVSSQYPVKLAW